jgi:hypothetical protein
MDGRGGFAKLPERSSNKWRDVRQWHKADIGHYRYHCRGAKPVQTFYSLISYLLSLFSYLLSLISYLLSLISYLFSLWRIFIQTSEQPYAIPIQKFDSMFFERDPYCIKISLLHERPAVNPFGPRNRRM